MAIKTKGYKFVLHGMSSQSSLQAKKNTKGLSNIHTLTKYIVNFKKHF